MRPPPGCGTAVTVPPCAVAMAHYTRSDESYVEAGPGVLAAKQATDRTLNGLLLGLGSVALLVGGAGLYPAVRAARLAPTEALGAA